MKIEYIRFNPEENIELLPGLVDCYREVFAESPWDEWKKCKVCGEKFGLDKEDELGSLGFKHCDELIDDFWPKYVVQQDIFQEMTEETSSWLALDNGKVIGFCWGYPLGLKAVEKKLEFPGLAEKIENRFGKIGLVGYQDELGVLREYRGKEIGKELFARRLRDFLDKGLMTNVVRAKLNPPTITYLWYSAMGYKTIGEYNDIDKRVILARTFFVNFRV